ncbi:MAG: hypothetical protein QOC93_113 [Actinomycetota bacterium]|nr:hypothetical protein [Actinomycetota bacterium]
MSSNTARFPSSRGRRAALLLTAGTASVALLSGCGAGQISQTAQKVASVEGVSASKQHIDVNDALLANPKGDSYPKGADAPLYFTISNDSLEDDRLVSARTDSGAAVVLVPAEPGATPPALGCVLAASEQEAAAAAAPGPTTEPAPSASASTSPSASASASGSATPSASGSASASASASPSPSYSTEIAMTVPHDGAVLLTAGCPHLVVQKLNRGLIASDAITLRLTFARAGLIELTVPVATPNSPLPREAVPGFNEHGAPVAEGGHGAETTTGGHG